MDTKEISGTRAYELIKNFNYIREAGTSGENKASAKLLEYINCLGLEGKREEFSFWTRETGKTMFKVFKPFEKEYPVTAYKGTESTGKNGIKAPFIYAENGDDFSLSLAEGKLVLLNDPVKTEMYQKLLNQGALGFLTVTGTPLDSGEDRKPKKFRFPPDKSGASSDQKKSKLYGASIHYQDAAELVTRGASDVFLEIEQSEISRVSGNVLARIEGTVYPDEILTLTAHYDSVSDGPGAYDNMSGAAIIMELCRYFSLFKPKRTIEFIWFGAEEEGLLGSRNYVIQHEKELEKHLFNMNVDLAGQLVGGNVAGVTGEAYIGEILLELSKKSGIGMTVKNQIWSSDSNTFAWKGIPAMTLNRDGFGMHTRHDTIDLISPWSLERSCLLLGTIAEYLANVREFPFQKNMPKKFKKELNDYFGGTDQ